MGSVGRESLEYQAEAEGGGEGGEGDCRGIATSERNGEQSR